MRKGLGTEMTKEGMLAKEEAHWSSFRSAVVGLQEKLQTQSSLGANVRESSSKENIHPVHAEAQSNTKDDFTFTPLHKDVETEEPQSALEMQNAHHEDSTEPQDKSKSGEERDSCSHWESANSVTGELHQRLELIGLEEVNKSGEKGLLSPANASLQTAQTNTALSIAESQLAEMRLKLAMAESERDELEFQLMQNS